MQKVAFILNVSMFQMRKLLVEFYTGETDSQPYS